MILYKHKLIRFTEEIEMRDIVDYGIYPDDRCCGSSRIACGIAALYEILFSHLLYLRGVVTIYELAPK